MADNLRTGEPDVAPDTPSHTPGNRQGNEPGARTKQPGHRKDNRSTARRSTGIRAKKRDPIVPGAPNISPP